MKSVLIKLSGELFKKPGTQPSAEHACMDAYFVRDIVMQIKQLTQTHRVSIVIGGGNFFRGAKEGRQLGVRPTTADAVGMLATTMNGLILQDFMVNQGVGCLLVGALALPGLIQPIDQIKIDQAIQNGSVIIFTGGTGNPFFSTDTAAVVRALQVGANEVWKATTVDHVYDADPALNKDAQPIEKTTYADVLARRLKVMDMTAIALAQEHNISVRIFSIYTPNALGLVAENNNFGSTISS